MTTSESPLTSARSARNSARVGDTSPRKEQRVTPSAHHSLPPLRMSDNDGAVSARGGRPSLSSARSDVSHQSSKSVELSARLKTSPYAVPMQLKTPVASARNTTSAGSARVISTPKGEPAVEHVISTPKADPTVDLQTTIPVLPSADTIVAKYEESVKSVDAIPTNNIQPLIVNECHSEAEPSLDELLEQEGLHADPELEEEEVRPEPIEHEFPDLPQNQNISAVTVIEEQDTQIPEEEDLPAGTALQSAISSIYCNNSTMIASIPEEMELTRNCDDERNVGAISPPEPSPTPVDKSAQETSDDENLKNSLNQALIDAALTPRKQLSVDEAKVLSVASPSPRYGVASQSPRPAASEEHVNKIENQIREELQVDQNVDSEVREITPPAPTERNKHVWYKMFCCSSKE